MYKKQSTTNQQPIIRNIIPQNLTMGKRMIKKRRHSHQSKILYAQQEPTFFLFDHLNTTSRLKHRNNTSFRPLASSTPYDIEQSNSFNIDSPHTMMRHQRPLLTPPVFCSTPKQTRRQPTTATSSIKRKLPVVISQRRLQFTTNSQSFVRHSNDESKRMTMKNVKIWLL